MILPCEYHNVSKEVSRRPAHIFVGGLGPDRVPLHTQGINLERIRSAVIMESIKHDLHVVIVGYVFPGAW